MPMSNTSPSWMVRVPVHLPVAVSDSSTSRMEPQEPVIMVTLSTETYFAFSKTWAVTSTSLPTSYSPSG